MRYYDLDSGLMMELPRRRGSIPSLLRQLWDDDCGAVDLTAFNKMVSSLSIQWDVAKAITGVANPATSANSFAESVSWAFGTTAGAHANQLVTGTLTIAGAATLNLAMDIMATLKNAIGTGSATFSKIHLFCFELLSAAQVDTAGVAGTACSGITLGDHATNAWPFVLGSTGTYTVNNGEKWFGYNATGAGWTVTTGDILKIVNNDAAVATALRVTLLGIA